MMTIWCCGWCWCDDDRDDRDDDGDDDTDAADDDDDDDARQQRVTMLWLNNSQQNLLKHRGWFAAFMLSDNKIAPAKFCVINVEPSDLVQVFARTRLLSV